MYHAGFDCLFQLIAVELKIVVSVGFERPVQAVIFLLEGTVFVLNKQH